MSGESVPAGPRASEKAISLIVEFEVSSQRVYERDDRHTTWPGGASGVTVGIGYDVGYVNAADLKNDWQGVIADAMITALGPAVGVTGEAAKALAHQLAASVDIPWDAANQVFRAKNIPVLSRQVAAALPNCGDLSPDSFGALVSLAYNRGVTFSSPGDRHAEMRDIKAHMQAKAFDKIPGDFRAMKRLWPTVPGLQDRREREAMLFEQGLQAGA